MLIEIFLTTKVQFINSKLILKILHHILISDFVYNKY